MKKSTLIFLLSVILLSWSCSNSKTERDIKMYTETWDQIINTSNIDLINNTHFTDSITLISVPENIVGIENVKAYYKNFLTGFSDIKFTMVSVFGQNDNIVKHWNFKGTHSGDFFGIPATGKVVDIDGVTLVKMKDGKIDQEQDFMDNMLFMQQLGIASANENVSVIDAAYKAFALGDIPTVLSFLDANVVWNEAESNPYASGNPYIGPDAVLNGIFARIGVDYEYFKLADIKLHDMSNNQVLATLRYQAKVKKNGAIIDAQAEHLWTLNNGKVVAFQQFVDTKKLVDAFK